MKLQIPAPSPAAQHSCRQLCRLISDEISDNGNWIPFSRFMELALYAPDFGYYTGGSHKIGAGGDFITAPALSPLFGKTLFAQLSVLLPQTTGNIYEFGAGTGNLAVSLLQNFSDDLRHYYIVELSPELAERQRAMISNSLPPETARKIIHLDTLPDEFDGIVIGNEVLDAMPVELVRKGGGNFQQIGVSIKNGEFVQVPKTLATPTLLRSAENYFPDAEPYTSELHPAQHAFVHTVASKLRRGGMIFIDYGFDAAQYYHPQRHMGTLIGHYRHHTVHDPFFLPGLTDLTAHVNFTDIA